MNEYQKRFVALLKTIFELDKSDLDFGIYRIINIRQREIVDYFENRLPKKIQEILAPFANEKTDEIKQKLAKIESDVESMGMTIDALQDNTPKKQEYIALQKQLSQGSDMSALESDVYSALYSFFNRYYDEGDFISKRRYKEGVYAIPYEGEEVKLYWANQDQYYIKTAENFKDYSFVTKDIGKEIITFLAQIENFQRKLWLKKKFVVETNWCITLDHIDESFYQEIADNKPQIQEWIDMYAIDEIKGDLHTTAFTNPPSIDFLKENQNLIVDTKNFSTTFRDRLIASIDDIDEKTNGLMINSENFQALKFLLNKYRESIQTVYIDPPYNTPYSQILYKNNYLNSSWLSLLNNTMTFVSKFWTKDFSYGLAIDDFEYANLAKLLDLNFPNYERSTIIVNHHPQGSGGRISRTHEYYLIISSSKSPSYLGSPLENYQEDRNFMRSGTGDNNYRYGRWKSFYALLQDPKTGKIIDAEDPVPLDESYPTGLTAEGYKRIYPINSRGEERVWRSSYITGRQRAKNGEIFITAKGAVNQSIDHEAKREVLFSNWTDTKYNAGVYGANILKDMGLGGEFDYPKSVNTLKTGLWAQTFGRDNGIIMDYFAGSGTTGHAVIDLNRQYKGSNRKYILVEMGEYFNNVTKPRIKKALYSAEWRNGQPTNYTSGVSQIMKYMRLESYEDALSNITLEEKGSFFGSNLGGEYLIGYMLDMESKGSLLNLEAFITPFEYNMKITEKNECKERQVDVVETFNYLIGLSVHSQSSISYFSTKEAVNPPYEGAVDLQKDQNGIYSFRQIEGTLPDGRKALIIWRNINQDNILTSNAALDAYFSKYRINPADREFDVIYINGDNNLENLRLDDEQWKVVLIETEFNKRMWEE